MKYQKPVALIFIAFCMAFFTVPVTTLAGDIPHPDTYVPSRAEIEKHKAPFDDPRPYLTTFGPKQVVPPALYEKLTYDIEEMKALLNNNSPK